MDRSGREECENPKYSVVAATFEKANTYVLPNLWFGTERSEVRILYPDHQSSESELATLLIYDCCHFLKRLHRLKKVTFRQKTAKKRDFIETLVLECDIGMHEKLFN